MLRGRPGGRLEEFDGALRINPDSAFGHGNRGVALHALGRYEEAIAAARRSLEIDPDSEKSYFVLGLALVAAQQPGKQAAESLRRAGASIPRARVMAAGLLANMGSLPDAIAEIDAYLKSGNQEFRPIAQQWRDKWAAQQSGVRVYR